MGAVNGSTRFQPDNPRAMRERLICTLFEPLQPVIRGADALHRAIEARDLDLLVEEDRKLQRYIESYLERVS